MTDAPFPPRLAALRAEINAIDDEILGLLAKRAEMAGRIGRAKREQGSLRSYDPEREREILDRLIARGAGAFPREAIRPVFREIMRACLALQEQDSERGTAAGAPLEPGRER